MRINLLVIALMLMSTLLFSYDITTIDGKTYEEVSVKTSAKGFLVFHKRGTVEIPYDEVSEESLSNIPEKIREQAKAATQKYQEAQKKLKEREIAAKKFAEESRKRFEEKKQAEQEKKYYDITTKDGRTFLKCDIQVKSDGFLLAHESGTVGIQFDEVSEESEKLLPDELRKPIEKAREAEEAKKQWEESRKQMWEDARQEELSYQKEINFGGTAEKK